MGSSLEEDTSFYNQDDNYESRLQQASYIEGALMVVEAYEQQVNSVDLADVGKSLLGDNLKKYDGMPVIVKGDNIE